MDDLNDLSTWLDTWKLGISESPRPATHLLLVDFPGRNIELQSTSMWLFPRKIGQPGLKLVRARRRPAIHKSELKSSEKMTYMYYTCRYVIIQLYMLKKGMLADLTIPLFAELDTSPSWIRWICCVVWNCESLNSAFPTFFNWKMATISKAKAAARK